ncbi:hypothetical protein D3C76_1302480 [compost metagenome]
MGGLHQGMLALQQLRNVRGRQLVECRRALMTEAERAATGPGVLDDGVVGQRRGGCGHGSRSLGKLLLFLW